MRASALRATTSATLRALELAVAFSPSDFASYRATSATPSALPKTAGLEYSGSHAARNIEKIYAAAERAGVPCSLESALDCCFGEPAPLRHVLVCSGFFVLHGRGGAATPGLDDAAGTRNAVYRMVQSGSKGNRVNLSQIAGLVGQQSVAGARVAPEARARTLPCFAAGDRSLNARGLVQNSWEKGCSPYEFFFAAMGGREGLVDTAPMPILEAARPWYTGRALAAAAALLLCGGLAGLLALGGGTEPSDGPSDVGSVTFTGTEGRPAAVRFANAPTLAPAEAEAEGLRLRPTGGDAEHLVERAIPLPGRQAIPSAWRAIPGDEGLQLTSGRR